MIPHRGGDKQYWGATVAPVVDPNAILQIAVDAIAANPWQPRNHFDDEKLQELAASIKEYGIIQPLIVTKESEGKYQLIAGERRLKAARKVGLATVPVIVRKEEDQKKLELSLIENLQRSDLNPLEEALSFKRLMDEFSLTQEEVAVRVGKSRSSVANFLRLLNLPKEALEALESGRITFSHAKVILSHTTVAEQLRALHKMLQQGQTVREATGPRILPPRRRKDSDPVLTSWEQKLTGKYGFPAMIRKMPRGGIIELSAASDEDLKHLLDTLLE